MQHTRVPELRQADPWHDVWSREVEVGEVGEVGEVRHP